jgi:hypothetical protein
MFSIHKLIIQCKSKNKHAILFHFFFQLLLFLFGADNFASLNDNKVEWKDEERERKSKLRKIKSFNFWIEIYKKKKYKSLLQIIILCCNWEQLKIVIYLMI